MKRMTLFLAAGLVAGASLSAGAGKKPVAKVPCDVHSGYFVSNKFEPDQPASFVVIRDKKTFDRIFGVAFVPGDKSHRLPRDAFKTRMVLAAIKRGKAMWTFKVQSGTRKEGVLTLKYSAVSRPSKSATCAVPLIVSIPKGDYSAFVFVENGKAVKEIPAEKK